MLERALDRGADVLILDLEDAVAPAEKPAAREQLARWLAGLPDRAAPGGRAAPELWVRVNALSTPHGATTADVSVAVAQGVTGVCLAKTRSVDDLRQLDALLSRAEARAGSGVGRLAVSAIIETSQGLLEARTIAAGPRVRQLQLGEADLTAELGLVAGPEELELLSLRTQIVVASAAAGIGAPVGPVSTDFSDLDAFRRSTERLLRLGFGGRAVIHPAQIGVVHEVFRPTPEEERRARAIVERFDAALEGGAGVVLDEDGRMVDEAVVRAARRLLERVEPTSDGG